MSIPRHSFRTGVSRWFGTVSAAPPSQPRSNTRVPSNLTQTGQFIGTVHYSSPEQILGKREIDHRADIYSLGCIMFEWEVGNVPFLGSAVEEIAYKHLEVAPPKLGGFFKRTAFGTDEIIERCLEKKPADRFQDYTELRRAVGSIARSRGITLEGNYFGAASVFATARRRWRDQTRRVFQVRSPGRVAMRLSKWREFCNST